MEYFSYKKKLEEKINLKDNFHMIESLKKINEVINPNEKNNLIEFECNKKDIISIVKLLKDDNKLFFSQLLDITAVDYPEKDKRFKMVYLLLSHETNSRILIDCEIKEGEIVPSLTSIFPAANWMEREVFDMYGIEFKDHPDLRRILTDYGFEGHPLRKDFPLTGHNEVRYSEEDKKVIYEPVKLEQNYRNFDYESPWEGTKYIKEQTKE